jgi:DNA-binding CsgD family transcriptional regulator
MAGKKRKHQETKELHIKTKAIKRTWFVVNEQRKSKMGTCITCGKEDELDINYECGSCQKKFAKKMKAIMEQKNYRFKGSNKINLPRQEIEELYLSGLTIDKLGAIYGVSPVTIYHRIKHLKAKKVVDLYKVKQMISKGLKIKEIASEMKVCYSTIYKKLNIELNQNRNL